MTVLERAKQRLASAPSLAVPTDVLPRLERGRKQMLEDAPKRRLCMRFERGDTYWYVDGKNVLLSQNTVSNPDGSGKPPHRIRNKYNFIRPIVEDKVSASTQRVPGYEVNPTTTDASAWNAAKLASAVALYGYDQWRVRHATVKTVRYAIGGGGDGFALPYFDSTVGPFIALKDGSGYQGIGEVKILVLSGNEVYWEQGVDFYDSRWHAVERAMPIDEIKRLPGYINAGAINPDANTSDVPTDQTGRDHMAMVTYYFERPSAENPQGRKLTICNDRLACQEEPYPLVDTDGTVLDEPVPLRLSYTVDPDAGRDFGLTWQLIDAQRTIQDCWNKLLEWKNRCLNPQMRAPVGSLITPPDDQPGAVRYYRPISGQVPEWEQPPPVPEALFRMLAQMKEDMREMAAYEDVHADPNVAAKTVQQVINQSEARWQSFLGDLADWHSRLMRRCLLLVARHYTEPRLLTINGRSGPYLIPDFRGAHLMGQVNVTVAPGTLQYRSRQDTLNRLQWINQNFPGWLKPEQALAALDGGTAEKLVESYELDLARANKIIQKIRDGSVLDMPTQLDAETGEEIPTFMPRKDLDDNLTVWRQVFADFAKTEEYDQLPPELQEVPKLILAGIQRLEFEAAQEQMARQNAMAEQQGMTNAAKPAQPKPLPDQPTQ